jgi:hypothetical protein
MDDRTSLKTARDAATASQIDPEFVDLEGLWRGFGIKRSLAYQLLADGLIKGVSLRRRNRVRGKRLFSVDSVRAYLSSQMEAGATRGGSR